MPTLLPKPPPMSGLTTRIRCSGRPATRAYSVRWACGACVVHQMVSFPVTLFMSATAPQVSIGDKEATDAVFAAADVVVTQDILYPRVHPAPMETCGAVADMNKVTGKLTIWCTTQAPHAHRTLYALVAGLPEHQIRVDQPRHRRRLRQQGRHLPRLRLRGRRVDRHRQAGEVDGGPLGEPDVDELRPRLPHARRDRSDAGRQDHRAAGQGAGRPRRVQQHGAADEVPGGLLPYLHRVVRPRGRPLRGHRRLHEQGARAASPTPARSG